FARRYWPGENAIGKRIRRDRADSPWITVVGVVANSRTGSLAETDSPQVYASLYQTWSHHLAIFLRGQLDPSAISKQVRAQVQAVDATLPVFGGQMLNDTLSASLSSRRFSLETVWLFALTALFLAAIGIYGVISYLVAEHTREIAIRLALGATRRNILRAVLRQAFGLAAAGVVLGLLGALVLSRSLAGLLYGVRSTDPPTFAGVAFLLLIVALLASYVPARRATRGDAMIALREGCALMIKALLVRLSLALASVASLAYSQVAAAQRPEALGPQVRKYLRVSTARVVLAHVEVIDGTGAAQIPDRNVTIEAGKITAISPGANVP